MEQPTPFLNRICLRTSSTQGRPTLNTSRLHKELVVLENCICVRSRRHCHTCGIGTLFFLYFSQEKTKENSPTKSFLVAFFHSVCLCIWKKQHSASQLEQLSASHQLSSSRKHFHMVKVVYFS